jgi:hypothetical protein
MSCNYCYIDAINKKHLPLICSVCHNKSFKFITKCECYNQCIHVGVPICANEHINRPILTKTCQNAFLSDEMSVLLLNNKNK